MTINPNFQSQTALRIWNNYFKGINRILRSVPKKQREELVLELKGHVLESISKDIVKDEANRVLNAIEKLGDPEDFIRPLVADRLLLDASNTLNPKNVFLGLVFNFYSGIKRASVATVLGIGYFFFGIIFFLTIFKIFFPNNFGFFIKTNGVPIIGFQMDMPPGAQDVLGLWTIPIGMAISFILYFILTKLLKMFFNLKK